MDESGVQEIRDMAVALHSSEDLKGVPVYVVPMGYTVVVPDTESHQDRPNRKRGTASMRTIGSFIDYVNRHNQTGTAIYYDPGKHALRALINGHQLFGADAGWGDHVVNFEPRYTPSWTAWTGFADHWMDQQSFAEFLEERIGDIASPDGAQLLEAATNLRATLTVNFESAKVLAQGTVQLIYQEEMSAGSAKKGDFKIPETLTLMLSPFYGSEAEPVEARLRISPPREGHMKFMVKLGEEVTRVLDASYDRAIATVSDQLSDGPLFWGAWSP